MIVKIATLILCFLAGSFVNIYSQTFNKPNIGLKSHETLEITRVEIATQKTVIYLTVENRITGGNFCADKNIFIIYPDGTRSKLISSDGIPVCPNTYKFKAIGEKLEFVLVFPPLKQGTEWIDMVEDCADNCFSMFGVTLNNELNKKIDDAFALVANNEPAKALVSFEQIAEETDEKNFGVAGLVYINIISLAREAGNNVKAAEWYNRLESSGTPRFELYIKHLNSLGISY